MVEIRYGNRGSVFEFFARGHAGTDKRGRDLVCAAVSILIYTLIESISEEDLEADPFVVLNSGDVVVRITAKRESIQKINGIFLVILNGFSILSKNFPKNIKIL